MHIYNGDAVNRQRDRNHLKGAQSWCPGKVLGLRLQYPVWVKGQDQRPSNPLIFVNSFKERCLGTLFRDIVPNHDPYPSVSLHFRAMLYSNCIWSKASIVQLTKEAFGRLEFLTQSDQFVKFHRIPDVLCCLQT